MRAGLVLALLPLFALTLVALLFLALGMLAGRKAATPKVHKPKRRSHDAGRHRARERSVSNRDEAIAALRLGEVGELVGASASHDGHVRIQMRRRKHEPCEYVVGYVGGLFEAAWASDVRVVHPTCAGRGRGVVCDYDVVPTVSPSAARAGGASTPRSAAGRDRSPPAPSGGDPRWPLGPRSGSS